MSCHVASQRLHKWYCCVVTVFTKALPWKRAWCRATRHGVVFNLPRLGTALSKHRLPRRCAARRQTSASPRPPHGVNMSQHIYVVFFLCVSVFFFFLWLYAVDFIVYTHICMSFARYNVGISRITVIINCLYIFLIFGEKCSARLSNIF
jgi:hypothetical protein